MRFLLNQAIYEKLKNHVTMAKKTLKNQSNFRPGHHVFARCDETVKDFWKIFSAMTSRVLYLSENIFATVQNCLVFSITWLNGSSKKDRLWLQLSPKLYKIWPKFVWSVNRKPLGAYQKHCSDLTPSDLEPRYWGQISDLRRFAACRPISLKFKYFVPLWTANTSCKFRIDRLNDRVTI